MFVDQQYADDNNASQCNLAERKSDNHPNKERERDHVEEPRQRESARDSEVTRNRMQILLAVMLIILATVENVEASAPEHDCGRHDKDAWVERSANSNPGGSGRNAHCESEKQMRPTSEALCEGVSADDEERDGR